MTSVSPKVLSIYPAGHVLGMPSTVSTSNQRCDLGIWQDNIRMAATRGEGHHHLSCNLQPLSLEGYPVSGSRFSFTHGFSCRRNHADQQRFGRKGTGCHESQLARLDRVPTIKNITLSEKPNPHNTLRSQIPLTKRSLFFL